MPVATVTDAEVQALGRKLDEFSEVLTEKERLMLLAMIRAAKRQFQGGGTSSQPRPTGQLPKLGAAFDAAFIPGKAAEFENETELRIGPIEIKGSITASVN